MKRNIFFLLSFLTIHIYAQDAPFVISEVIEIKNVDKNELFVRGREWFNENFKNSKEVLQIQDKETGELSGKGIFTISYVFHYMGEKTAKTNVSFLLSLWVKDGKYKYELTNLVETELGFGTITVSDETKHKLSGFNEKKMNDMYKSIKTSAIEKSQSLIDDLKKKMSMTSKSSDW